MAGPLDYRTGRPDLSSSSPLANMTELSSSDPISPGSPTPSYRRTAHIGDTSSASSSATIRPNAFLSHTSSHPDPFSANAKASPNSHPSFGKGQLRAKHFRNSPQQLQPGAMTWADDDKVAVRPREGHAQNVLAHHFFDSSDDNLSSDDPASMFSMTQGSTSLDSASSTLGSSIGAKGLGICDTLFGTENLTGPHVLGDPFREPTSPTPLGKKLRARKFERTQSSSHDPFSAAGGSSARQTPNLSQGSPHSQHAAQRRRLTGTSPKKLSRAASSGQFPSLCSNASDSDDGASTPSFPAIDMHEEVSRIFTESKLRGRLLLNDKGVTSIHPVIADLSKYVHFPTYSSFSNDDDGGARIAAFSRTSSLSNASDHLAGQSATAVGSPSRTRSGNFAKAQSNDGLQVYLANNSLKVLSSALFSATNITMLTLRNNAIGELPAAIGVLCNLRELNLSGCGLQYLPAEIQQLRLTTFTYFPNPFKQPPEGERVLVRHKYGHRRQTPESRERVQHSDTAPNPTVAEDIVPMGPPALPSRVRTAAHFAERSSFALAGAQALRSTTESSHGNGHDELRGASVIGRVLGEASHQSKDGRASRSLPTLHELCIRRLLRPEGTKGYNGQTTTYTLLERYEAGSLSRLRCHLGANNVKTLEAARRSACGAWGQLRPASSQTQTWCSGSKTYSAPRPLPRSASSNPQLIGDVEMRGAARQTADDSDEGEASAEWSSDEDVVPRLLRSIDVELELDKGDDARYNPWFNRCPNPKHSQAQQCNGAAAQPNDFEAAAEDVRDWPCDADGAQLFSSAGVERFEWVTHIAGLKVASVPVSADLLGVTDDTKRVLARDAKCIPLLWRGCGANCLDFLEDV